MINKIIKEFGDYKTNINLLKRQKFAFVRSLLIIQSFDTIHV